MQTDAIPEKMQGINLDHLVQEFKGWYAKAEYRKKYDYGEIYGALFHALPQQVRQSYGRYVTTQYPDMPTRYWHSGKLCGLQKLARSVSDDTSSGAHLPFHY